MTRTIQNKELRRLLDAAGLEDVLLCKGNGYFYITSDNADSRVWGLAETSIYICNFHDQTPRQWLEDIQRLFNN